MRDPRTIEAGPIPTLASMTLIIVALLATMQSCSRQKEELVFPPTTPCDSTGVSFASEVKPVIDAHCMSCHSLSLATASVVLEQYSDYDPWVSNGKLIRSLEYNGSAKMPPDGKLPACDISKIRNWVHEGALDN